FRPAAEPQPGVCVFPPGSGPHLTIATMTNGREIDQSPVDLQTAKLRALAEFAAGAGHEINNPVATIVAYVQQLLATETDPDRRLALATIGGQAYRIRDMIGDLMLFARPPQPRPEMFNLTAVCREVADKFAQEAADAGCALVIEATSPVPVFVDPTQLRIVIS